MVDTVAQMSPEEFRDLIQSIVKKTFREELKALLEDPDSDLELRDEVMVQLMAQAEQVAKGERGRSFDELVAKIEAK